MAREAVILSMKCSPKADSVPLLPWLVPSIAWTELSDTGTDNLGGNKSVHLVHRLAVCAFKSYECVNGRQGQEQLVLQGCIACLLALISLDSFPQFACCFTHEYSPPFAGLFIH